MNSSDDITLTSEMIAHLGFSQMAYIKPVVQGREVCYAVCAADGTQLAIFPTQEAAYFTAKQHDLEPVSIH